jgi:hypothetical protein
MNAKFYEEREREREKEKEKEEDDEDEELKEFLTDIGVAE